MRHAAGGGRRRAEGLRSRAARAGLTFSEACQRHRDLSPTQCTAPPFPWPSRTNSSPALRTRAAAAMRRASPKTRRQCRRRDP
eukprot:scaffold82129_cov30-Phaeocystis_antarctica.AAC.1